MRYTIFVSASSAYREEKVTQVDASTFKVTVKASREKGRANERMTKLLGDYFKVSPSLIRIISGHTGTRKIIETPQGKTT